MKKKVLAISLSILALVIFSWNQAEGQDKKTGKITLQIEEDGNTVVDTVFDRDYSDKPPGKRNGYVFYQSDYPAIESAMARAIGLFNFYPNEFRQLILNGMQFDHTWNHPGQQYLEIYNYIKHK